MAKKQERVHELSFGCAISVTYHLKNLAISEYVVRSVGIRFVRRRLRDWILAKQQQVLLYENNKTAAKLDSSQARVATELLKVCFASSQQST